jgi:hypothetical protein
MVFLLIHLCPFLSFVYVCGHVCMYFYKQTCESGIQAYWGFEARFMAQLHHIGKLGRQV